MTIQHLAKCFVFTPTFRSKLTFSDPDKIRLNPVTSRVELSQQRIDRVTGEIIYPTDTDLFVTIAETNPDTLKQWIGFQPDPASSVQPAGTSVKFKLNDGTDDRYWGGTSWDIAGASDWSTEADVADNIDTFPATSQKISVIANLQTTDEFVTPYLSSVDLLMECDLSYIRSLVADSLVPALKSKIRPLVDFALRAQGGTRVSLNDLETAFNIISVQAVYNHSDDPDHLTDLLSSYDSTAQLITLTSSVDRGDRLFIRFLVEPEVYVNWTSQDYIEVEKIPAVVLDGFGLSGNEVWGKQSVVNNSAQEARVRRDPLRLALDFDVLLLAENNRVLMEMFDESLEFIQQTPLLRWVAVDEDLTLRMIDEPTLQPRPNLSDKHQAGFSLRIQDVFLWLKPEEILPLVQRLELSFVTPDQEGGVRWTGQKII